MSVSRFLKELRRDGIQIWLDNDQLRYRAPKGALTTQRLQIMKDSRDDILRFLKEAHANRSLVPVARDGTLPLSFAQQRLWFLAQFEGGSAAYHMAGGIRLKGRLDSNALSKALDCIVARHEVLRTSFVLTDGEPVQRIAPEDIGFALSEVDLRKEADPQAALRQLAAAEATASFDLERGPLIRGRLVRLGDEDHVLLVTMHHIVSDGWSIGVLMRELSALYEAFSQGKADPLPPLPVQYADYAAWQRGWLAGGIGGEQARYWQQALAGAPVLLELPADHPRPARQDYAGAVAEVRLDADLSRRLKALSQRHGVTLYASLLAGWAALLSRLSGQEDVVIGSPTANRRRVELEGLIGLFVNTLAMRVDLSGSPSVTELIARVKAMSLGAQSHQDLPFEQVVELVKPPRSPAHAPVFQTLFAWQNTPEGRLELPELTLSPVTSVHVTARLDLSLHLGEAGDEIVGGLEYATALFERETIERYLGYWRQLLEGMVADDTCAVDRLPLLSAADRQRVLCDWNATDREYPRDKCIHELFEAQAARTPEAVAVECGERQLTYGELNVRANRLAHYLRKLGISPDARVALCVERSLDMVVALLAVLKAGGAYVPFDPAYPAERLAYMLADSAPMVVLTDRASKAVLSDRPVDLPTLDLVADAGLWVNAPATNLDRAGIGLTSRHLAYAIYTSGSTGTPKGVMNEHRGVVNRLIWMQSAYRLASSDAVLQKTPFSFDVSVWEFFWPLLTGARLVMARPEGHKDPAYLAEIIQQKGVTTLHFVPSMLQVFLEHEDAAKCFGVARVICSGEALPAWLVQRFQERLPTSELHNLYGPTEAAVDVTAWNCAAEASTGNIPIGRPISNTKIYILDVHGEPVPIGVTGELYIGGVQVARGYLNRPELTAERFLADPFAKKPGARMYRTGDLGRWLPDGIIEFLGRNDFQVKLRGFRIELGEIEARLMEQPQIREAVVVARADGADDKRLVAYYAGDTDLGAEALRGHLAAVMPDYMVPSAYVRLDALPLTPSGKLDRKALPAPEGDAYARASYEPPQGEIEETLARIWAELLGRECVGRHDNFFELGGHSLLAVTLVSRLRQALDVEVPLASLFARPMLSDFARDLGAAAASPLPPLVPVLRDGALPLSFAQQRLWFLAQFEGGSAAYHMAGGIRLNGRLDSNALSKALDCIVARHEVLRTSFAVIDGEPVQRIAREDIGFALSEVDLRKEADPQATLQRLAAMEATAAFDLERGPMIRGQLVRLADEDHVLLVTMHHIVSDGWSIGVLMRELSALYEAFSQGKADPLPPLPVQYADYAAWQRGWLAGGTGEEQARYWQQALAGAPVLLELPSDHARPAQQDYAGALTAVRLDAVLSQRLKALSLRHGATLHMVLLASWAGLLSRLSGQDEVVVGSPSANRRRTELEGLIGFFVNTLALRVDLSGSPSVAELIARVKAISLGAQSHQDLPFEQVVEIVKPARSLAHAPVFQALFAWQNTPEGRLELPGLTLSPVTSAHVTARLDLSLHLGEAGDEIVGGLEYATALFERETIERYLGYWRQLLEGMVADDTCAVDRLPLLSAADRQRVLCDWNATDREYPRDKCIHELFEAQAARTPEAIAVECGAARLTYGELNVRANRLAHYLRKLGISPDARVALCVERSLDMVVGLLAVLKAGGAYVPLDPAYPKERLAFMLEDSAPVAVLTDGAGWSVLNEQDLSVPVLDLSRDADLWSQEPDSNPDCMSVRLTPRHLAYIIYTSGSTGAPKGVMVEHGNVTRLFAATSDWFQFGSEDIWTLFHSYAFDFSVWEVWGALLYGGRLVVVPLNTARSSDDFYGLVCRRGVTVLNQTPSAFRQFITAQKESQDAHRLRYVIFGGEALDVAWLKPWYRHRANESTALINMYGITETTVHVTYYPLTQQDTDRTGGSPVGCRIPDLRIYILDGHGEPAPIGVAGEIYVGGAGVARGYLNRPELTAERFVADPFAGEPGARMYKTGDLARYLPDGNIEFLGRNDFQVKIRGFRIELGEIEARLSEHIGVREAVVLAREDVPGDKRLVAYYVSDGELEADTLRSHLLASLPDYMVPAAYVRIDNLPLTPNGKLDSKALPAPDSEAYARAGYEAPQGEVEETLATIWAELLGLERIGRHDNFFELGGHSLLAVTLVERLRRQGLQIDVRALFASPSLSGLAAAAAPGADLTVPPNLIPEGCTRITPEMLPLIALSQAEIDGVVAQVPGGAQNVQDIYPLAPLQEGILFHHLLAAEGDAYLVQSLLAFDSRERLDGFWAALEAVIARHDILRTSVVWEGLPQPAQVVWRKAPLRVEEIRLDPTVGDMAAQLKERFDPRHFRLDVRQAPLLCGFIAEHSAEGRWLLLLLSHHLADDNTTLRMLFKEIHTHVLGHADQLARAVPFRNFVAQARLGVSASEHEAFFRGMLGDVEEATLPFGLVEVQGDGSDIEEARLVLEPELCQRLRARARVLGVSTASLFHLAFAQILARTSGREDVVFGTVLFGRLMGGEGADQALGIFINTLPIRLCVGEEGAEASVRRTQASLAELLRHEHASLALAQRCSAVPAPLPLFSALLNYRHIRGAEEEARPVLEGIELLSAEERTNYPLTISVDDLGEGFLLTAQVHAPVGAERVCGFMRTALASLAEAMETAPKMPTRRLAVLPKAERHRLLVEWNATEADYPRDKCVHELFEEQVARTPEAIAVECGTGRLTYGELNTKANRLAHHLRGLGVGPDARVALCLERSLEMMVGLLAVLKSGGAYVPLDPAYPAERLVFMIEDSAPVALITDETGRAVLSDLSPDLPVINLGDKKSWAGEAATNLAPPAIGLTPDHLAYVIYTSGSTGLPKGVMVEHKGVHNYLRWAMEAYAPAVNAIVSSSLSFDATVTSLFVPLLRGGIARLLPEGEEIDGLERLLREVPDCGLVKITPAHLTVLGQRMRAEEAVGSASLFVIGGEALSLSTVRLWQDIQPGVRLVNEYGPTETVVGCVTHEFMSDCQSVPIGRPIANTKIYILDAHGEPVPIGVTGELYIGGAGVARGYLNRPELSAERFLTDPFAGEPAARMYRTGDLGCWLADGNIKFLGRNDFQVKVRGFRIELGEIEARLLDHDGVNEAVVIAREDNPGDKRLVAYYVGDAHLGAEALRGHLAALLPDYMLPSAYVKLETLPLTPNGKLNRQVLPAPDGEAYVRGGYEPPQGEVEETLATIWAELLGVERVGRHDNFFELGGHSLLAVQFVSMLKTREIDISLAKLFAQPTIEALAREGATQDDILLKHGAIAFRTAGDEPPLFLLPEGSGEIFYGSLLTRHLAGNFPVYGLQLYTADVPALRTLEAMAARLRQVIRAIQPTGPYRLAGWSFGGNLAYEIAAQLIGEDEVVQFIGLIDSHYAPTQKTVFPQSDEALLRWHALRTNPSSAVAKQLEALAPTDFATLFEQCQKLALLPKNLAASNLRQMLSRIRTHTEALSRYLGQALPVPVHLFAAQHNVLNDIYCGWGQVMPTQQIHVLSVPGDHDSMVTDPHVLSLGAAVSSALQEVSAKLPPQQGYKDYSPLVTIQEAPSDGPSLFCIPGAGANVAGFIGLAEALGRTWHVQGLQPRGLDGLQVPHSTIPAAARAYLNSLEKIYPEGQVHLLGHSFGGCVAFEMALQLQAAGRPVTSLALIDSRVPDAEGAEPREYNRAEALIKMVQLFEQSAECSLGITLGDLDALVAKRQLELLHERLVRAALLPPFSHADLLLGPIRAFETALRTPYNPKTIYSGTMRLAIVSDAGFNDHANQRRFLESVNGWQRFAPNLVSWQGPGNHMTVLKPPYVTALADWMLAGRSE